MICTVSDNSTEWLVQLAKYKRVQTQTCKSLAGWPGKATEAVYIIFLSCLKWAEACIHLDNLGMQPRCGSAEGHAGSSGQLSRAGTTVTTTAPTPKSLAPLDSIPDTCCEWSWERGRTFRMVTWWNLQLAAEEPGRHQASPGEKGKSWPHCCVERSTFKAAGMWLHLSPFIGDLGDSDHQHGHDGHQQCFSAGMEVCPGKKVIDS